MARAHIAALCRLLGLEVYQCPPVVIRSGPGRPRGRRDSYNRVAMRELRLEQHRLAMLDRHGKLNEAEREAWGTLEQLERELCR